jgi:mannan endo-1,4-beta-mannosidase
MAEPSVSRTSGRTRALAGALGLGLIAASYVVWTSPVVREQINEPMPRTVEVVEQVRADIAAAPDVLPTAEPGGAAPGGRAPAPMRPAAPVIDKNAELVALVKQVTELTAALKAGNKEEPLQLGTELARYLKTERGIQTMTDAGWTMVGDRVKAAPAESAVPEPQRCWDFPFQQDAQAAYAADLADPSGLDGAPGANNDDGMACEDLLVDPARPLSVAVGAAVEPLPVTPELAAIKAPAQTYFGVFTEQSPGTMSEIDLITTNVEKVPNSLTFFAGWDTPFRADHVLTCWKRGMLPIISWESRPLTTPMGADSNNAVAADYTLANIINGQFDAYIDQWATDAKTLGLPIALRFNHEMNGYWYPWSEQANGNSPGEYVRAWRHVHDRFTAIGATNVVWIWSPNVISAVKNISLAKLYPGDAYVDWSGLSGYYRRAVPGAVPSFTNTFGASLTALRAAAKKPIFITEVGVTENGGNKPAWIKSMFTSLPAHPDIIGFT